MKVSKVLHPQFLFAFDRLMSIPLPIKELIEWKKWKNSFFAECKIYESIKNELIDQYCEKDEKGRMIFISGNAQIGGEPKIKEESKEEFDQKIDELVNQDFKCEIKKIKLPENTILSDIEFDLLQDFIDISE